MKKLTLGMLLLTAIPSFAMILPPTELGRHMRNLPPMSSPAGGFHIWNVEKLLAPGLPTHPTLLAPGLPTHPTLLAPGLPTHPTNLV
ncbi:MAG TPA: hypothetical protein VF020_05900 [Chthoniobacterales bacterium]